MSENENGKTTAKIGGKKRIEERDEIEREGDKVCGYGRDNTGSKKWALQHNTRRNPSSWIILC